MSPHTFKAMATFADAADSGVAALVAPNWWVAARAVWYLPAHTHAALDLLSRAVTRADRKQLGWTHETWRTTRGVAGDLSGSETSLGVESPTGECVVALVPLQVTRLARAGFAGFVGEVARGCGTQAEALARCRALERLGLTTDLWLPLPTIR
jgi:hypothetical protein